MLMSLFIPAHEWILSSSITSEDGVVTLLEPFRIQVPEPDLVAC
jgi:hypothetical protein